MPFIDDPVTFVEKTDLTALPGGADETKYVAADDWNGHLNALLDLRTEALDVRERLDDAEAGIVDADVAITALGVSVSTLDATAADLQDQIDALELTVLPTLYDVRQYGLVINSEAAGAANSTAIQALVTLVVAAGGGHIYFPPGVWYFAIGAANAVIKLGNTTGVVNANLEISGDGDGSVLAWGGTAGSGEKHFLQFAGGVRNVTFRDLKLQQNRLIVTPDGDQHHCFDLHLSGSARANVENFKVINCTFGTFKGDCVRTVGALDIDGCQVASVAATGGNTFAGPFIAPVEPQYVVVYITQSVGATWDGGVITVTGTDRQGAALVETFTPSLTTLTSAYALTSVQEFETVTGVTKASVGVSAATVQIGYVYIIRGVHVDKCRFDGDDLRNATATYGYRSCVSVQRLTYDVWVTDCHMRGSDDQLLEFEPTGDGEVGYFEITGNKLYHRGLTDCVTLSGNGSRDQHKMSVFSNNKIVDGKLSAVDLYGVSIDNNKFFVRQAASQPVIGFTKSCALVHITNNDIVIPGDLAGTQAEEGIAIRRNGDTSQPRDIIIRGNNIEMPLNTHVGIYLEDCVNTIDISGNSITNTSAVANSGVGIYVTNPANTGAAFGFNIADNQIKSTGGGTLQYGELLSFGQNTMSGVSVQHNKVSGSGIGISILASSGAGGWSSLPIVQGNDCYNCTTQYSFGTGVYPIIQGNAGNITHTIGGNISPETVVTAVQGSRHTLRNGSSTLEYYKTTGTAATGWAPTGGVVATGSITCVAKASMADTDIVTIGDGVNPVVVYEFDVAGDGVTAGRVQVNISTDTTATQVAARLLTAITANQPLFTVVNTTGVLALTHKQTGTFANVTITEAVANAGFLVTGMSGGINAAAR